MLTVLGELQPLVVESQTPFEPTLLLTGVSRSFGAMVALAPLSVSLAPGTISLVTGHNGSGKSTLLRIAAGMIQPSSGARSITGTALYLRPGDAARRAQTTRQALDFVAAMSRSVRRAGPDADRIAGCDSGQALDLLGLTELAGTAVGKMSSGQMARVTLAVALVSGANLVCLDEPTAHLDADGAAQAAKAVATLASHGAAVLVATHDHRFLMEEADARLRLSRGRLLS